MLTSSVLQSVISQLTTGIFYTGFLASYGFDIVNIGIITLMPYIANLVSLAVPGMLHRFKKRKAILVCCKLLYYTLSIAGFTIVPMLTNSYNLRIILLCTLLMTANIFNGIAQPGFVSWHAVFIPDSVRTEYLTVSQFLSNLIPGMTLLFSGVITDALSGTPHQQLILILLRWLAYAVAIADTLILCLPKEYEYSKESSERWSDVFRITVKNRNYMLIMVIVFVWNFTSFAISSPLQVYLLNDVKVTYTYYNLIIILYSAAFPLFAGFWRKRISKYSWLSVYGLTLGIYALCQLAYAFVNASNYLFLMTTVRLIQHMIGVGQNIAFLNMPYLCLPPEHKTCYISLYQFITNLGALMGLGAGTVFCDTAAQLEITIFSHTLTTVPILLLLTGAIQLLLAVYAAHLSGHLKKPAHFPEA